jgi:hypothetical protein
VGTFSFRRTTYVTYILLNAAVVLIGSNNEAAGQLKSFGDPGHESTGGWTAGGAYPLQSFTPHFQSAPDNFATSTWTFSGLANGTYYVGANWESHPNRTTQARFTVSDGGGATIVDQTNFFRESGEIVNGKAIGWKTIGGAVSVNDGTLSVKLDDNDLGAGSTGYLFADSIRLSTTPFTYTPTGATIIDSGNAASGSPPGHQFLGEGGGNVWGGQGPGYDNWYWFDNENNFSQHTGALSSEFSFTGLTPGVKYSLSATWVAEPNRATNAPFTISGIVGGDQTVFMDQQQLTANFMERDSLGVFHGFESLGAFEAAGSTITVTLSNNANGFVIPDAVRLVAVPEPGSLLLFACGVMACGLTSARRKA